MPDASPRVNVTVAAGPVQNSDTQLNLRSAETLASNDEMVVLDAPSASSLAAAPTQRKKKTRFKSAQNLMYGDATEIHESRDRSHAYWTRNLNNLG